MTAERIRAISLPADHPYVRAIADPTVVEILPAPGDESSGADAVVEQFLIEAWDEDQAADADLVHVHFGFELVPLSALERFVAALDRLGLPLVLTVHDLENPQLPEHAQDGFVRRLEVLLRHAVRVITLTEGARAEIIRRWSREVIVVPHPPLRTDVAEAVVASTQPPGASVANRPSSAGAPVAARQPFAAQRPFTAHRPLTAGILLKDARPSLDLAAIAALAQTLESEPFRADDWRLTVIRRPTVRAGREAEVAELERLLDRSETADVEVWASMSDRELEDWLARLDVLVLPYRHGTHSGLLDLANDLGTRVLYAEVGHLGDQRPGTNLGVDFHDDDSLRAGLYAIAEAPPLPPLSREDGLRLLAEVRDVHTRLYRSVTARPSKTPTTTPATPSPADTAGAR
ncbi:glycosyltransferase [Brevibacterium casei]|uniref:Methyl-accepting chemotaxis protein n=1 Tax=Brevibacterium casei S18 TaxID=1229781 RepID=K9B176_9MICO|nr:glycosyltransferase [Brevibacterium casei]EKU47550.1 methyl-accepting chemotaxis protein [Brevibacterium casei S18]MBE4696039.1 glycosyltransferase [Brevibacterium casei]MBY3579161.1 glycosyltransferase family 4 protein [Brevibacterium casei]MCT2181337.1 glycosyltransferase family 4 protein [Brevibacterium casei]